MDPSLSAFSSATYSDGSNFGAYESTTVIVGLRFNLPLYKGAKVISNKAMKNSKFKQSIEALKNSEKQASYDVKKVFSKLKSSLAMVEALKQANLSTKLQLEASKLGLEVGVRTAIDVLNSEQQMSDVNNQLFSAIVDSIISHAQLKYYAGVLTLVTLKNKWAITVIKLNNILFLLIFLLSCSQSDNYIGKNIDIYPVEKLKLSENKIYIIEDSQQSVNQDLLLKKYLIFQKTTLIQRIIPDQTVTFNNQTDIFIKNKDRVINNNSVFFNVIIPKNMEQKFIIGNTIKILTENETYNGYVNFSSSFCNELENLRIIEIKLKQDDSNNESTFDKILSIQI